MNTFEKALKDSLEKIKENKKVIDQVELIALLGSVSEKEAIDNYSDLDILIILKSNELGSFKRELIFELRRMVSDLSNKYKVKISFLTHTFDDFKNYVDLEYLNHYSWGDVIYTNNKSLKEEIEKIINIRGGLEDNEIRKLMIYNLRHARFNILREYISLNEYNTNGFIRSFGRKLIDKIFEVSDWCLIYNGVWSKNKRGIVDNIDKVYNSHIKTDAPHEAYNIRKEWNKINDNDLEKFFPIAVNFIVDIIDFTISRDIKNKK